LAERLGSPLAHALVLVLQSSDEGLHGAGVADLAERLDGPHAYVLVLKSGDEGLDGGRADLDALAPLALGCPVGCSGRTAIRLPCEPIQRPGGRLSHVPFLVLEGGDEGLDGAGVADLAERPGCAATHALALVLQGGDEGLDGAGVADLAERPGGSGAHVLVLDVPQRLDQPLDI